MKRINVKTITDKYSYEIENSHNMLGLKHELELAHLQNEKCDEQLEYLINYEGYNYTVSKHKTPDYLISTIINKFVKNLIMKFQNQLMGTTFIKT